MVAVEYPKTDVWSIGFVTGDSIPRLKQSLGKDLVSIFIPTSPMPMTGFTINVPRSQVLDLELTIDQAIQFMVSCGVVCPTDDPRTVVGSSRGLIGSLRGDDQPKEG